MNSVMVVGRIVEDPTLKEVNDKNVCNITLAVSRPFKNANGEYETDFLPVSLWNDIANSTADYCKKGDVVGVKGRMQAKDNKLSIVAERISFIASKSKINDINAEKDMKM